MTKETQREIDELTRYIKELDEINNVHVEKRYDHDKGDRGATVYDLVIGRSKIMDIPAHHGLDNLLEFLEVKKSINNLVINQKAAVKERLFKLVEKL